MSSDEDGVVVMEPKRPRTKYFFDGDQGESLFHKPLMKMLTEQEVPALLKKVEGEDDHRLIALVTAMLVEDRIDKILSAFLPKYEILIGDGRGLTYAKKVDLLEASNLIPPMFVKIARCLGAIRNKFAHKIQITGFEELPSHMHGEIKSFSEQIYPHEKEAIKNEPLAKGFSRLSFYCIAGIDTYIVGVDFLRKEFSTDEFVTNLEEKVRKQDQAMLDEIMNRPPHTIEDNGTVLVERFERGVTRVTGLAKVTGKPQN